MDWLILIIISAIPASFNQIYAKRTFTTFVGGELFHESNLTHKIVGCLIMIIGAICIAI